MCELQKNNKVLLYIDNALNTDNIAKELVDSFQSNELIYTLSSCRVATSFIEKNCNVLSMVIMDWELWDDALNNLPTEQSEIDKIKRRKFIKDQERENTEFIKVCLDNQIPVVIFSRHNEDTIESTLIDNKLITSSLDEQPLLLFSQKKNDIRLLFDEWYSKFPSIKIYDIVKQVISDAQKNFFSELIVAKNSWIRSLWDLFCDEYEIQPNIKFNEAKDKYEMVFASFVNYIITCVENRVIINNKLNEELVDLIQAVTSEKDDARRILENGNYMNGASIPPSSVAPGDIYSNGTDFYINVRAECDTARLEDGKVLVYLLKGELLSEEDFVAKYKYLGKYNQLLANETYFVIPYICSGKIIKVQFKDIFTAEYNDNDQSIILNDYKLTRVGRVLSPYSRKLQQKYSQYLTRIGLTSIPKILRT